MDSFPKKLRLLSTFIYKKEKDQYIFQGYAGLRHFQDRAPRLGQVRGPSAADRTDSLCVFNAACTRNFLGLLPLKCAFGLMLTYS